MKTQASALKSLCSSFIILLTITLALVRAQPQEQLKYEATTVANLAAGKAKMTRAHLTGYVTFVEKEGDGDIHIRVCDSATIQGMDKTHCIVAEIMPCDQKNISVPKIRQQIDVAGITRYDDEHKWWELHPVSFIK